MEWIKDYWYFILIGLIAAMFIFKRRPQNLRIDKTQPHQSSAHTKDKTQTGGHGCCH